MTATAPRPANSQVSRARCIRLQRTSVNTFLASTGRSRSASRLPLSVNGMSVVPVCCPLRLHAVSPCRIAKTVMARSPTGSHVVGFRRTDSRGCRFLPPSPADNLRHVVTVPRNVFLVIDELVADRLLSVRSPRSQLWHAVNHITDQTESIEVIHYAHVEGRRRCALFLVAAHMDVVMAVSPVGQAVDQ